MPRIFMIFSTVDRDGLPLPLSIFLMVEMAISDMSARSYWVIPKALRCNFITSWIFISSSVLYCTFCAKIRNVFRLNKQKYHIMFFLWKIIISWDFILVRRGVTCKVRSLRSLRISDYQNFPLSYKIRLNQVRPANKIHP